MCSHTGKVAPVQASTVCNSSSLKTTQVVIRRDQLIAFCSVRTLENSEAVKMGKHYTNVIVSKTSLSEEKLAQSVCWDTFYKYGVFLKGGG